MVQVNVISPNNEKIIFWQMGVAAEWIAEKTNRSKLTVYKELRWRRKEYHGYKITYGSAVEE